ncbi:MAG: hypothetical protein NTX12_04815 [Actinobacteria bacterium]|nr:hypothetical protein [Actinomycetota bacterium]
MLIRRAALALRLQATLLFLLSVLLVANPEIATRFLGFTKGQTTAEVIWLMRLLGATLLLPALLAPLVAAFAGERGLRQAASGMAFISLVIGTVSFISPLGFKASTVVTGAVCYIFALFYFYALRGRGRNR